MKRKPTPQSTTPLIPIGTRVRLKEHLLWRDYKGKVSRYTPDNDTVVLVEKYPWGQKMEQPYEALATTEQLEIL